MKKILWFIVFLMTMVFVTSCDCTTECIVCGAESESGSIFCYQHRNYLETEYGSSSSRCAAKTKNGKRCSRTAEKGSIYCWQHKYNH